MIRVKTHYLRGRDAGFVEGLDRITDALFALLVPSGRFWLQRGLRK